MEETLPEVESANRPLADLLERGRKGSKRVVVPVERFAPHLHDALVVHVGGTEDDRSGAVEQPIEGHDRSFDEGLDDVPGERTKQRSFELDVARHAKRIHAPRAAVWLEDQREAVLAREVANGGGVMAADGVRTEHPRPPEDLRHGKLAPETVHLRCARSRNAERVPEPAFRLEPVLTIRFDAVEGPVTSREIGDHGEERVVIPHVGREAVLRQRGREPRRSSRSGTSPTLTTVAPRECAARQNRWDPGGNAGER